MTETPRPARGSSTPDAPTREYDAPAVEQTSDSTDEPTLAYTRVMPADGAEHSADTLTDTARVEHDPAADTTAGASTPSAAAASASGAAATASGTAATASGTAAATPLPGPGAVPPLPGSPSGASAADAPEPKWRKGYPGFFGIANVIVSGLLAVVWAWLPISILVFGLSSLLAMGFGLVALLVWFGLQRFINRAERYRAEAIYGDHIASLPTPASQYPSGFTRFLHTQWLIFRTASFWRSTAHHFLKMLYGLFVTTLAGIGFTVGGGLLAAAINPTFIFGGDLEGFNRLGILALAVVAIVSAIAVLIFSPYADRGLDRALLPPTRTEALRSEVATLDRARVGAVDAANTERLRIERDLHDGVQPMLVATSMKIGMAKSKLATDPEAARALLDEAHKESKAAITELRQLARGIHPAVLSDRGLDAAISAIAARSVVPVLVSIDLDAAARPAPGTGGVPGADGALGAPTTSVPVSAEAEAVAYFVVAEALTNINKHSQASEARVSIYTHGDRLTISVTDNGRGGAQVNPAIGSGLSGLVDRVHAARGTWALTSPVGGPTTLVVEVPCA